MEGVTRRLPSDPNGPVKEPSYQKLRETDLAYRLGRLLQCARTYSTFQAECEHSRRQPQAGASDTTLVEPWL